MTKIYFFNFYHNGDLFHSKPFVREVVNALGKDKVYYAHYKDPLVIRDLGITSLTITGIPHKMKFHTLEEHDAVLINTWIGSYFDMFEGECTLNFNMKMWEVIYDNINAVFNTNLKLGPVENYMPYVDYSKFDLTYANMYLDNDAKTKVLFCNGPAMSGQCAYNDTMKEFIEPLAIEHPDKTFLITHKLDTNVPNVIYTSDITKSDRCDLNEISYLSKYCSLIIGRSSGPFCFASTGENLNDPRKTFYAFGTRHSDCFTYGIDVKSKYIYEDFVSKEQLSESIKKLVAFLDHK